MYRHKLEGLDATLIPMPKKRTENSNANSAYEYTIAKVSGNKQPSDRNILEVSYKSFFW